MLIVQKFGGSSLADIESIRRSADRSIHALRAGHSVVVVVSACGGTTNELDAMARTITPKPHSRELDALLTSGEQQSAALMAILLQSLGASARSLTGWQAGIITDSRYGDANIKAIVPDCVLRALRAGEIAVVTGFQGLSPDGDITSLGRGGSDTTAVALAAALNADRCEIYTDVDGIYSADPRLIADARLLEAIDLRDMLNLSLAGSQVLHSKSVAISMREGVEIRLLSSFTSGKGSAVRFLPDSERPDFAGVTRSAERGEISVVGKRADANTLLRITFALKEHGIDVLSGRVSEGTVSIKVSDEQLLTALGFVHAEVIK